MSSQERDAQETEPLSRRNPLCLGSFHERSLSEMLKAVKLSWEANLLRVVGPWGIVLLAEEAELEDLGLPEQVWGTCDACMQLVPRLSGKLSAFLDRMGRSQLEARLTGSWEERCRLFPTDP